MNYLSQKVQEIFVIFLKFQKISRVLSIFVVKVYEILTPKCPVFRPSDYKRELLHCHLFQNCKKDSQRRPDFGNPLHYGKISDPGCPRGLRWIHRGRHPAFSGCRPPGKNSDGQSPGKTCPRLCQEIQARRI